MSVTINNNAAQQTLERGAERLQRTVVFYTSFLKNVAFATPNPLEYGPRGGRVYRNSSKPGEYPHKRTGQGIAGVIAAPLDKAGIVANNMKVRAGIMPASKYMAILELFRARKGFVVALNELKPQLQALLAGKQ